MKLDSLRELYIEELKDLHSAETQILKALPKMVKAASAPELQAAFEQHLEQTKTQKERLEQIFDSMGGTPRGKTCKGIKGIIEEGKELMDQDAEASVLDAGLIGAAQKVEHYEIATYGTALTYAEMLGQREAAELLQRTLQEEENTDRRLSELAERLVNVQAAAAESD